MPRDWEDRRGELAKAFGISKLGNVSEEFFPCLRSKSDKLIREYLRLLHLIRLDVFCAWLAVILPHISL